MAAILSASSLSDREITEKYVHPSELDIYDKPSVALVDVVEEQPSELEQKVSGGRKQIVRFVNGVKDVFGEGQIFAETATVKTSEFMQLISTDQTFQIKVGVISSSVLVGAILAGRGRRRFKRIVYSAGLGTIAYSACYPQKAWDLSKEGFEQSKNLLKKVKEFYDEQQQKHDIPKIEENPEFIEEFPKEQEFVEEPTPVVESVADSQPETPVESEIIEDQPEIAEEIVEDIKDIGLSSITSAVDTKPQRSYISYVPFIGWFFTPKDAKEGNEEVIAEEVDTTTQEPKDVVVKTEDIQADSKEVNEKAEIGEDHGQSNPEDKDLYSTRS